MNQSSASDHLDRAAEFLAAVRLGHIKAAAEPAWYEQLGQGASDLWNRGTEYAQNAAEYAQNAAEYAQNAVKPVGDAIRDNVLYPALGNYAGAHQALKHLGWGLGGAALGAGVGGIAEMFQPKKRRRLLSGLMTGGLLGGLGGAGASLAHTALRTPDRADGPVGAFGGGAGLGALTSPAPPRTTLENLQDAVSNIGTRISENANETLDAIGNTPVIGPPLRAGARVARNTAEAVFNPNARADAMREQASAETQRLLGSDTQRAMSAAQLAASPFGGAGLGMAAQMARLPSPLRTLPTDQQTAVDAASIIGNPLGSGLANLAAGPPSQSRLEEGLRQVGVGRDNSHDVRNLMYAGLAGTDLVRTIQNTRRDMALTPLGKPPQVVTLPNGQGRMTVYPNVANHANNLERLFTLPPDRLRAVLTEAASAGDNATIATLQRLVKNRPELIRVLQGRSPVPGGLGMAALQKIVDAGGAHRLSWSRAFTSPIGSSMYGAAQPPLRSPSPFTRFIQGAGRGLLSRPAAYLAPYLLERGLHALPQRDYATTVERLQQMQQSGGPGRMPDWMRRSLESEHLQQSGGPGVGGSY